jgi:hypothetical protein
VCDKVDSYLLFGKEWICNAPCVQIEMMLIGHVVEPSDSQHVGLRTNIVPFLIRDSFSSSLADAREAMALPSVPFAALASSLDPEGICCVVLFVFTVIFSV